MWTIVLQDADAAILEVLSDALQMEGFKVFGNPDLNETLMSLIDTTSPDVVMLDFVLRGDAAKQMCRRIKEKHPRLPVIALSCNLNIDTEYAAANFDDYIRKPFDLDTLYQTVFKYVPLAVPHTR